MPKIPDVPRARRPNPLSPGRFEKPRRFEPGSEKRVFTLLRTKALRKVPYRSRQAGVLCALRSRRAGSAGKSRTTLPQEGSMTTTATRLGKILRLSSGAIASMGLVALAAGSQPAMAQKHGAVALTGTVSSSEEGKMEGVVVSAKRPGSTIMVSASTNAQEQYRFAEAPIASAAD